MRKNNKIPIHVKLSEYNPILVSILVLLIIIIICLSVSMHSLYSTLVLRDAQIESLLSNQQEVYTSASIDIESKFSEYFDDMEDAVERLDEAELRMDDHAAKIAQIEQKQHAPSPSPTPTQAPATNASRRYKVSVSVSQNDIRNIAALVYLEAGSQSYKCQKAIASVIINRMKRYNKTASQVIWEPGVFSPAYKVSSTRPSEQCLKAVRDVLNNGTTLPKNVVAFRNGHYHSFGKRYCCIDGVYFTSM